MTRRRVLATDLPAHIPRTPERRLMFAVIERWWEDLTGDAVSAAIRAEAEACLHPGYSRNFEFAVAACELDLDALRTGAKIAMRRRRSCRVAAHGEPPSDAAEMRSCTP